MRKASLLIFILFLTISIAGLAQTPESTTDTATINSIFRDTEAQVAAEEAAKDSLASSSNFATNHADTHQPEMADALREDGKIYVVVLVLATIFAGIIAFLVRLDRKISKLEKSQ